MPSLVDIFNPSFFMFLGILVLVVALLVVYFETKMREQNHKMASMLNLVTCMADEMNSIKVHLTHQTANFGIGGTGSQSQPQHSSLETNNVHIVKTDLIAVSDDDDDDDSDNHSENSIEDDDSESNSEDVKEVIEIGGEVNDIKVLKLNLSITNNINDIDIDENKNVNDFEELGDLEFIDDEDDNSSIGSLSVSSEDQDTEQKNIDELDISTLNLKSINISSLEEVKNSDSIDYKKLTLSKLRSIVVEKELVVDSSKLKKNELLKMLGAE